VSGPFSYLIYGVFALGAAALLLAMPRPNSGSRWPAAIVGAGAVIGLIVLLATRAMAPNPYNFLFYLFAASAVLAAAKVVSHPVPAYSAAYFALVVLSVAVLVVMRQAEFLAVALVIIYAGAILVTYAFVLMLAQQSGARLSDTKARRPLAAIVMAFVAMGAVAGQLGSLPHRPILPAVDVVPQGTADVPIVATKGEPASVQEGNTRQMGERLFGEYMVVVQVAGLLLLIAMVGAIAMARKAVPPEEAGPPPPPPGEIGRNVAPF
jgi:NADH-quinone oxidoreductase subunit J